jgi:hypothetical protein
MISLTRRERNMTAGVPILCQIHMAKSLHQIIDHGNNRVGTRYGKRPTGAEVILDVDDDECRVHGPALQG